MQAARTCEAFHPRDERKAPFIDAPDPCKARDRSREGQQAEPLLRKTIRRWPFRAPGEYSARHHPRTHGLCRGREEDEG